MRTRSRPVGHGIGDRLTAIVAASAFVAVAGCSGGSGSSSHGAVIVWHGYTDAEATAFAQLGREWNQAHPDQKVNVTFAGSNDDALKKTLASFVSGKVPGVAYE